ncbi:MAG: MFS transporter [Rhodobiaceae bacterium]|nr:MFS transporter [Rhodobiaceae bacterium]
MSEHISNLESAQAFNVEEFINARGLSVYQWMIFLACFLLIAVDTYDIVAIGFAAPVIREDWGINASALGPVMSLSLVGMAIGALLGGPLTDQTSPKTVMVGATFFFGICVLATAAASSVMQLAILRLLTGIGIGAAIPNAPMLVYEFSPSKRSSFLVNLMGSGGAFGSVLCGLIAAFVIPRFGWQSLFIVGGALPIALALACLFLLPEPIRYMVQKGDQRDRIASVLRRIDPATMISEKQFVVSEAQSDSESRGVSVILSKHYALGTVMIWITYVCSMIIYYLLMSWLPSLIRDSGASISHSSLVTTLFTVGGIVGGIFCGFLMDRVEKNAVLALAFVLGGVAIVVMGQVIGNLIALSVAITVSGLTFYGAISSMAALASAYYPTNGRATGLAWMYGVGRFGGILGPFVGGMLLERGSGATFILTFLLIPTLIAAAALLVKRFTSPCAMEVVLSE